MSIENCFLSNPVRFQCANKQTNKFISLESICFTKWKKMCKLKDVNLWHVKVNPWCQIKPSPEHVNETFNHLTAFQVQVHLFMPVKYRYLIWVFRRYIIVVPHVTAMPSKMLILSTSKGISNDFQDYMLFF